MLGDDSLFIYISSSIEIIKKQYVDQYPLLALTNNLKKNKKNKKNQEIHQSELIDRSMDSTSGGGGDGGASTDQQNAETSSGGGGGAVAVGERSSSSAATTTAAAAVGVAPPVVLSRYESQKRRDWNTFLQYLKNHKPPLTLSRCSGAHVIEFMKYLDQFGKTKVHVSGCAYFGHPNPPAPCPCPLKQAWGSLDALIGRLRAAYEENGGRPESNPFGARAVRIYLREVREGQAKARGIPYEKKKRKRPTPTTTTAAAGTTNSTVVVVTDGGGGGSSSVGVTVTDIDDHTPPPSSSPPHVPTATSKTLTTTTTTTTS